MRAFLAHRYANENITPGEIETVINGLEKLPAADLYDSNRTLHKRVADGFLLKREPLAKGGHTSQKDLYVQLVD